MSYFRQVVVIIALIPGIAFAQTQRPAKPPAKIPAAKLNASKKPFEDLWKAGKWSEAEKLLEDTYATAPDEAAAIISNLLDSGSLAARPLAAAEFAKHATISELADRANRLNKGTFPDERRLFLRAIGARAHAAVVAKDSAKRDEAFEAAARFVDDADLAVAAAAINALADTERADSIGLFVHKLIDVPATTANTPEGDRQLLSRATIGAIRTLTGEHPQSVAEAKALWNRIRGEAKTFEKPKPKTEHAVEKYGGQKYFVFDRFNVFYRIGSTAEPPADGALAVDKIGPLFERAPEAAEEVMTPIVGRSHIPSLRLYLCDSQQFNAMGGNDNFAGLTGGNEVQLKVDMPTGLLGTLWHEYIHVIHQSNFVNQPRWLAEGLAMSLTISPKKSNKLGALAADPAVVQMVEKGAFTEMVNWNSGGSTDSKETARYHIARLCIDYLRYGGLSAENERLAFMMGRLSRRQSAKSALEEVYGRTIRDLDAGLRDWIIEK